MFKQRIVLCAYYSEIEGHVFRGVVVDVFVFRKELGDTIRQIARVIHGNDSPARSQDVRPGHDSRQLSSIPSLDVLAYSTIVNSTTLHRPPLAAMFGPFRLTAPLSGGLLW